MKKFGIYFLFLSVLFAGCKNEKELKNKPTAMTVGALTISTDHPKPGETIDIAYKNPDEVDAFYTYMVGTNNYPVDINFKMEEGEQKSSIKIPDSAVALAFLFKTDDKYDDNSKQGYLIPLYNDDGKKLAGSSSAMATYAQNYGPDYGIKTDAKEVMESMKSDLAANPELQGDWQTRYLRTSYKQNKEEGKKEIDNYLAKLSKKSDKSEKDYMAMMELYNISKEQSKYDSVKAVAIQRFPKGKTANFEMVDAFQNETDLDKKTQILNNFSENNPKLGDMGNYMANNIAMAYYDKKDMANFDKYSNMVEDKNSRASSLNNLAWKMAEVGKNLDQAEMMSKKSLDLISSMQKNPTDKPDYYSQKQYEKSLNSAYSMYADTYALILFKQGKIKEAIAYQEKAHDTKAEDADANARYIEYLMADKQYEMVNKKAEEFIGLGHGNDKIKEAYKTAYLKVNPDSKDFDGKLKALEDQAQQNAMADIKKSMLDEEAPKFTLKDIKGEMVSLESLKGKTVILDFWATWCGPCKASFPAMQKVVTKYKDNDNVKLLFVDTFETGNDREKNVVDFIKKNKYDFHVVYDSDDSDIANKYGVTGIPTKIVIGPDGKMRFKAVGYNGSVDKLVDEMDMMIGALKP
ncbi:MAG: redoxin domain-containing protein [Aquaticitalea sp.]